MMRHDERKERREHNSFFTVLSKGADDNFSPFIWEYLEFSCWFCYLCWDFLYSFSLAFSKSSGEKERMEIFRRFSDIKWSLVLLFVVVDDYDVQWSWFRCWWTIRRLNLIFIMLYNDRFTRSSFFLSLHLMSLPSPHSFLETVLSPDSFLVICVPQFNSSSYFHLSYLLFLFFHFPFYSSLSSSHPKLSNGTHFFWAQIMLMFNAWRQDPLIERERDRDSSFFALKFSLTFMMMKHVMLIIVEEMESLSLFLHGFHSFLEGRKIRKR